MKIQIPNLPQKKVTLFAVADGFNELHSTLKKLGAEIISVKADEAFEPCESNHPDMHIHHLGNEKVVLYREDEYLAKELKSRGFETFFAKTEKQKSYPCSAALNACRIGSVLLLNPKSADNTLIDYANQNNLKIVHCRQGYTRCAVCIVSQNAVITSDESVFRALDKAVDVLKISSGGIRLIDGYDGMIGGCSTMIDKDTVGFCGDITRHRDFEIIEKFLKKHGVSYVCLTKGELVDVGTVLPLETE